MPRIDFDRLPDEARLWIFGASRRLTTEEAALLLGEVDGFLETWNAHGTPLTCARDWWEDRFLLVAVDERTAPPSGCSIDAMVGVLKGLETRLDAELTGHGPVFWRGPDGEIRRASRGDFQRMADEGDVGPGTPVFDPTLTRMGELRAGKFETPARASWHGRAFWTPALTPPG